MFKIKEFMNKPITWGTIIKTSLISAGILAVIIGLDLGYFNRELTKLHDNYETENEEE